MIAMLVEGLIARTEFLCYCAQRPVPLGVDIVEHIFEHNNAWAELADDLAQLSPLEHKSWEGGLRPATRAWLRSFRGGDPKGGVRVRLAA
jgi:hypothetical protein